jgi:hypothetical protein
MQIVSQILTGIGFLVSRTLIDAVFVKKKLSPQRDISINQFKQVSLF